MANIAENIQKIKSELPDDVTLVAVSKTKPNEDLMQAYDAGQRVFGENKAREMEQKHEELPKDIEWHFIGHLQRNKVKYIAPFVKLIHSLDSLRLAKEINKRANNEDRVIDCLVQLHISGEETKFGFDYDEAIEFLRSEPLKELQNIRIVGAMGMALHTDDKSVLKKQFGELKSFFDKMKKEYDHFKVLSMGMTNDYEVAVEEGSNMVRLGSSIFGPRNYK